MSALTRSVNVSPSKSAALVIVLVNPQAESSTMAPRGCSSDADVAEEAAAVAVAEVAAAALEGIGTTAGLG